MKRFLPILFVVSVLSVQCFAKITISTVPVGNPGNAGELSGAAGSYGPERICGAVGYTYNIAKYEVTAGQYCDFLNKVAATDTYGLYNASMWSYSKGCKIQRTGYSGGYSYSVAADWANRPANLVTYWNACRFANWLHNGQPTGLQSALTTEDGVYTINGYNGYDGRTIQRKAGWKWAVTSEDEWYKAAYYKGGGTNAGYWDYPTRSDTAPSNVGADGYTDPGNHANYSNTGYTIGLPYYRTNVGEFESSASAYGTFDQAGNVWEWNEAVVLEYVGNSYRGLRGGSYGSNDSILRASYRNSLEPPSVDLYVGFRVVQAVPEPSSLMILAGGVGMILGIRRRRA